jgi:hypothetical protein
MSNRICRDFARGNCRWKNCKFAHVSNSQIRSTTTPANRTPRHDPSPDIRRAPVRGLPNADKAFREWQSSIPCHTAQIRPSSGKKTTIFQQAKRLIESDASARQEVIRVLASEDGLRLILDLVNENFEHMDEGTRDIIFKTQVLPFLETISNPGVLSSLVLEQSVGTIYNVLFGIDGTRAARWLNFICDVLETDTTNEGSAMLLEASLHTFSGIVDLNSTAPIRDCLHTVAGRFEAVFTSMAVKDGMRPRLHQSRLHLDHVLRRLETGKSLPMGEPEKKPQKESNFAFAAPREEPGGRHNNDSDDICAIQIMPTFEEISSLKPEYLPLYDPRQWHVGGIVGLLDRNFRLLREDTVGQLRDAIYHELNPRPQQSQLRKFIYPGSTVVNMDFNWLWGLYFEVDFPQPKAVENQTFAAREMWWQNSKRLQPGALVCLIVEKNVVLFCTVTHRDMSPRRKRNPFLPPELLPPQDKTVLKTPWKSSKSGSITLMLVDPTHLSISVVLDLYSSKNPKFSLVEFPGVLLPSFEPALRALQTMKKTLNLPFAELFVPWAAKHSPDIPPPSYALKEGFAFNLRCLMNNDTNFWVRANAPSDVRYVQDHTMLDHAQANALINCLKQKLGLIQGPPGTGKSYTGVALVKVMLANKDVGGTGLGPILCVTYTNHALDQLLEALLDNKVTSQIIRIGSQSKSERLDKFNLQTVAKDSPRTKMERKERWSTAERLSMCEDDFRDLDLKKEVEVPIKSLKSYIQRTNPHHHDQLFSTFQEYGFVGVKPDNPQDVIKNWLHSGPKDSAHGRSWEQLQDVNVSDISQRERERLYNRWYRGCRAEVDQRVMRIISSHRNARTGYDNVQDETHLRCLSQADVIGATTAGLARRLDMFRRLPCKFMLCEEAGEVLESHILTAFLPSVEHAVLIGDQQQLRPQVQNYDLSSDNHRGGKKYSLDVSLFERLVSSKTSPMDCAIPFSALETQRRMHPSIARLIRETIYPNLKDDPSVAEYPEIKGVRKRLFWLDHRHREGGSSDADPMSTSHWNEHEINMTVALVNHLVQQGEYKHGDIAVLTPYLGQLYRLRKRLTELCAIIVGDRDQNDLEKAGLGDIEGVEKPKVKATLSQTLRVATVDNFQGEEAKVVVISLVRSNAQNNCGFLRTSNRINVLLSRAQHGMYIIGNSVTSIHVPMWARVVKILKQDENIGKALELQCPRHPETPITVSTAEDFPKVSPEGGCNLRCVNRLACGHACLQKCHSDLLHNAVVCLEPCTRSLSGCDHSCPKRCGDTCPGKCLVNVYQKDRTLPCGHPMPNLPCWQSQDLSTIRCVVRVDKKIPGCDHVVPLSCYVDVESKGYRCVVQCRSNLPCGHTCKRMCYRCVTATPEGAEHNHGKCEQRCGRPHSTCAHTCNLPCHGDEPCPPCQAPCEVRCSHSNCPRKCYEPCTPCAEEHCLSKCPHSSCSMPCAAPCDHVPCSKRCPKKLDCGHQCPSLCGEKCPPASFCQTCGKQDIKNQVIDFIQGQNYEEVNLDENPCIFPKCGHFLTVESMDAQMDMASHYVVNSDGRPVSIKGSSRPFSIQDIKTCATCRSPLRDISRYGRLVRRAILDESTKKLILVLNGEYVPLAQELPKAIQELQATESQKKSAWPPVIEMRGTRAQQIQTMIDIIRKTHPGRWHRILSLRKQIDNYRRRVKPEEQPFERVRKMVEAAQKKRKSPATHVGDFDSVLQTKGFLQGTALILRLDIALIVDFMKLVSHKPSSEVTFDVDWQKAKDDCQALINLASAHHRIVQQAEGHIFIGQLCALEVALCSSPTKANVIRRNGRTAIAKARQLCGPHRAQTLGLANEIDDVDHMLHKGSFRTIITNDERMAVISAMRREFLGTGHWYYCRNGHPFTIGECGGATELSHCPECGAPVGGHNHELAEGVTRAMGWEEE